MRKHPDLLHAEVAIVGLGLMGGSLALALRGKCKTLTGVDIDATTVELACTQGVVDRASCSAADILPAADIIILAAPVDEICSTLAYLAENHPGSPVILDLGSTKRQIITAMEALPDRFDPVGGHPMCGKEKTGLAHASSDLYYGAAFALTLLPRTSQAAAALAWQIAQAVGARPMWLDAETHDRWTAATSHLPYLLACALTSSTPEETRPMLGPGFRSTARVAGTGPKVMLDILASNSDNILAGIVRFRAELDRLEALLKCLDMEALDVELDRAAGIYNRLVGEQAKGK